MLPKYLEKYFWDTDFKKVNKEKNKDYIIAKVLEHGDIPALKWLFANFSQRKIKNTFAKRRGFSKRVANFWQIYFNLPKENVLCLNNLFPGIHYESAWPY